VEVNKRQAIKSTLLRLGPHAKPEQVIEELERLGIEVSERFVAGVKMQMRRNETKAQKERAKRPPKNKSRKRPQNRKIPKR
jgi:hypothetical protein